MVCINLLIVSICRIDWHGVRSTRTQQVGGGRGGGEGRKEHETSVCLAASVAEVRQSSCKTAVECWRSEMFFPQTKQIVSRDSENINQIHTKIGTASYLFLFLNVEVLALP